MKQYITLPLIVSFALLGSDTPLNNERLETALRQITPLQRAVIEDDAATVENILNPDKIQKLKNHFQRTPSPEELCDQITTPKYMPDAKKIHFCTLL